MRISQKILIAAAALATVAIPAAWSPASALTSRTEMTVGITIVAPRSPAHGVNAATTTVSRGAIASTGKGRIGVIDGDLVPHLRKMSTVGAFGGASKTTSSETTMHVSADTLVVTRSY